ncbi:hypothetical protein K1719_016644 [Acacia pycnantha]|nr:hypothetical protein K1719_016644 [Acacia pycnantha]
MALHRSCIIPPTSFKPQLASPKAQLSKTSTIKWKISEEFQSTLGNKNIYDDLCVNHEEKLKVVRNTVRTVMSENYSLKGLHMVDELQRLNIDYHFQEEIDSFLWRQYVNVFGFNNNGEDLLHETSLRFRLLRQQGHYVPAKKVFDKFTDEEENFKEELRDNIKGMKDLYEASHLSIEGEDILDEAGLLSEQFLKQKAKTHLDSHEAKSLKYSIEYPFHKSLPMFTSKNFLGDYNGINGWLGSLRDVANLDFKLLQFLYQKEILQISKWWTGLGLANELRFARDQPLKWYIWSLACLNHPSLSEERVELTKVISFIYLLDDIFDVGGTVDELTLFTEAVTRWDGTFSEQLPDHMKFCFKSLYDLTNKISNKVYQKHGWNPIDSLHNAWKSLCKAFLVEAKWFAKGKMPKAEEYLENGLVSSGVHIVIVHVFFLLGEGITQHKVHMIDTNPPIISSSATILRLWDDLGSSEDENQEGNDGSYVHCLMMENEGTLMKRAREETMRKISEAWKRLNKECFFECSFPKQVKKASLNLARMVPLMYGYDHNQSLPQLEQLVNSFFYMI